MNDLKKKKNQNTDCWKMLERRRRKLKIETSLQKSREIIGVLENGLKIAKKIIKEENQEVQTQLLKKF